MKTDKIAHIGLALGAVALTTSGVTAAAPDLAIAETQNGTLTAEAASTCTPAQSSLVSVANVQGTFKFDQNALSATEIVSSVFNKAAATLCNTLPTYKVALEQGSIALGGDVSNPTLATVDDIAEESGSGYIMACACATNLAGGGAIMNAEVSGVSVETLAKMAGAN